MSKQQLEQLKDITEQLQLLEVALNDDKQDKELIAKALPIRLKTIVNSLYELINNLS